MSGFIDVIEDQKKVARIAELEAAVELTFKDYADTAAALAERDRMLRWLWEHTPRVNYSYEQWLADLCALFAEEEPKQIIYHLTSETTRAEGMKP